MWDSDPCVQILAPPCPKLVAWESHGAPVMPIRALDRHLRSKR